MQLIKWDETTKRLFETGIDHGVLYLLDPVTGTYPAGYGWNGLISVSESPSGAEPTPIYADNIKYLTLMSTEELGLTLEAYTYPPEFAECDGSIAVKKGVNVGQQPRKTFGLSYRTKLGNDTLGDEYGYKLHLIYGCLAAPSEKAYSSVNDSPEAITFSWELTTTPVAVNGFKPTAIITIDSTQANPTSLLALETLLYGVAATTEPAAAAIPAVLPLPDVVLGMFAS